MVAISNNAEGGTSGTTVTTANSGGASGDAFGTVTIETGMSATYEAAASYRGGLGYWLRGTAAARVNFGYRSTTSRLRFRTMIYLRQFLGVQFLQVLGQGGATAGIAGYVQLDGTGHLLIINSAGTVVFTSPVIPLNTWLRLETVWVPAAAGSATVRLALFNGEDTTPIFDQQLTGQSISVTNITGFNFGKSNGSGTWTNGFYFDELDYDDVNSASLIGPVDPPTASPQHVATYGSDTINTTTPKTTSVTVAKDDLLVVIAQTGGSPTVPQTPTGGAGFTWQKLLGNAVTSDFNVAGTHVWSAVATQTQTFTMSVAATGGDTYHFKVLRFDNHGGIGAVAQDVGTSGRSNAPSLALTTTKVGSTIVMAADDWNAADGTSHTYNTTSGPAHEASYAYLGGAYTSYIALYPTLGAVGSKTVGLTAPSSQNANIVAIEVLPKATNLDDVLLGSGTVDLFYGGAHVDAVYLGATKVWP